MHELQNAHGKRRDGWHFPKALERWISTWGTIGDTRSTENTNTRRLKKALAEVFIINVHRVLMRPLLETPYLLLMYVTFIQ